MYPVTIMKVIEVVPDQFLSEKRFVWNVRNGAWNLRIIASEMLINVFQKLLH